MSEKRKKVVDWFRKFTWKQRLIMYVAVILLAVVYIFVFSDSNYRIHKKLNTKIAEQEAELEKQKQNIATQSTYKNIENDSVEREHFIREQLNMKKPNEDVYILK